MQHTRYHLEIFYADSPLGPWQPHLNNPVTNGSAANGGRMGGRVFAHAGQLFRLGQDCGETYGHRLLAFHINKLSTVEFRQLQVPLRLPQTAWNLARHHHLDPQQVW